MKRGAIARKSDAGTILAFLSETAATEIVVKLPASPDSGSEVLMSGRRSHTRFEMLRSPEGVLRVFRDVAIQSTTNEQIIAISREPGVLGESVSVQLSADDDSGVPARVLESHPIVVDGSVRHQLRLHYIRAEATPSFREPAASPGGPVE